MKKYLSVIILSILSILISVSNAFASEILVKVNGISVVFPDAKPFIDENSRTQVPVRAVAEATGYNVSWNEETKTVSIYSDEFICDFIIGSPTAAVKYKENDTDSSYSFINMDTDAVIVENRTYIPVNYLAKAMGMTADWDGETQTVNLRPTTESDLPAHFPLDASFPESHFAAGYTDGTVPEAIANALSNNNVVYGDSRPIETMIETYDNSVDISDKVYKQEFQFNAASEETESNGLAIETPVFGSCNNLAVDVTVDSEPVWITISISRIDADNKILYCCREWHAEALDKSITVDFDNLDSSAKYFV